MNTSRLTNVAAQVYATLNTPRSLALLILLRNGEWDQLVAMRVDPRNYLEGPWGARAFASDSQATDFLRKSPLLGTERGRRESAEKTFSVCEEQCFATNQFLRLLEFPSIHESVAETAYRGILSRARKIARRILGPVPDDIEPSFGPGTSFELKGAAFSTLPDKLTIIPTATPECLDVFEHYFWPSSWGRERLELGLPLPGTSRGNRFSTVPKDSTTHRGICIEPLGNLWIQLGIGRYLKRRLSNVGISVAKTSAPACPIQRLQSARSVEDGQVAHRRMARLGSLDDRWATIDLSNASDTVAFELVRAVLPPDWFRLLCSARSPFTFFRGKWHRLEKFSSMGNGFTFELETLLFACLISATTGLKVGQELFVYGDDILVPGTAAHDTLAVLRMSGFTPNPSKSFHCGPFRESCGGDFFSGYPVRSYFSKGTLESPLEWVAMHNSLLERLGPAGQGALERIVREIPTPLRLFGPSHLGDIVLHGRRPRAVIRRDQIAYIHAIRTQSTSIPLDRWGSLHLTAALLGCASTGVNPRGRVTGWSKHLVSVS